MVDSQSATAEIKREKRKKERRGKKKQDENITSASTAQGGHKQQTTALSSKAARTVMALNWFCQAIGQIYLDDTTKSNNQTNYWRSAGLLLHYGDAIYRMRMQCGVSEKKFWTRNRHVGLLDCSL